MENLLNSPFFDSALNYIITLFGAAVMYMFSLNNGFQGAVQFLKKFFPGRSPVFYDRGDFFIVIFAGAIIGTIFFSPSNALEALAAGFGWVGAINVLTNRKEGE
ncbi:hypothetical protein HYR99_07540 [Candidatus Poribacteria bacterium]|nr:hypothetical protein [Candidatus Poribacteria bacterium]